jgi:prepilin-type N-terminal cleavage/methylation domain-containing protein
MEEKRDPQKGMSPRGFTLMELLIVLGLLAIVAAISYPSLMRFYSNGNLRSAARDLMGDFSNQKQRAATGDTAVAGARLHRISLNLAENTYTLQRCTTTADSSCSLWEEIQVKNLRNFGNDIVFDPEKTKTTVFYFETRGTVTFSGEGEIEIVLRNNRGSTATITANISGRTFLEFDPR